MPKYNLSVQSYFDMNQDYIHTGLEKHDLAHNGQPMLADNLSGLDSADRCRQYNQLGTKSQQKERSTLHRLGCRKVGQ